MPFSSPLHLGRAGWAVFVDRGAAYARDTRLLDAEFDTGVGAGFFAQFPGVTFRVDVAHGLDHGTRAHVTIAAAF
jgi:outer membrane translocation and assembly module TamA